MEHGERRKECLLIIIIIPNLFMEKKPVLNSLISIGAYREFIQQIFSLVMHKIPSYVCFANVHMVVEGYKDITFQKIVNNANVAAPDGKPVSLFLQYFGKLNQDRVCGMDLFPDLLQEAERLGKSIYLYGTTDELLTTIIQKAKKEFPSLKISGFYSPPFRNLSEEENISIIAKIKATSPDLVFVSLGCPKQEKWMAQNRDNIGACLLGVGQAFKVYAGVEKRLPKWMRNLSLEWLYRFYLEPQRLWKRYLFTNSYFLFLTFQYMTTRFIQKISAPFGRVKLSESILQESDE